MAALLFVDAIAYAACVLARITMLRLQLRRRWPQAGRVCGA